LLLIQLQLSVTTNTIMWPVMLTVECIEYIFSPMTLRPNASYGLFILWVSGSHLTKHHIL